MAEDGEAGVTRAAAGLAEDGKEFDDKESAAAAVRSLQDEILAKRLEETQSDLVAVKEERDKVRKDLEQAVEDGADTYYHLHRSLDDQYDIIAGLEKQILTEQAASERQQKKAEKAYNALEEKKDHEIKQLTHKLSEVELELKSLVEFKERKVELERLHAKMVRERGEEREEQRLVVEELERKLVSEKARVKREMLEKIRDTKRNVLAETEDQLHDKTKRTMMENEQKTLELQYQSREAEKLLKKNKKLAAQRNALEIELQLSQEQERELAKRTQFYQKLIKKLHEKLKSHEEAESAKEDQEREEGLRLESLTEANHEMISALQEKSRQLERNMEDVCLELENERRARQAVTRERDRLLLMQDETVRTLLASAGPGSESRPNDGVMLRAMADELLQKFYTFQTSTRLSEDASSSQALLQGSAVMPAKDASMNAAAVTLPPIQQSGGPQELLARLDSGDLSFPSAEAAQT